MRTAVFFGLIMIASAINDSAVESCAVFNGILGSVLIGMDVYDFIKPNNK